MPYYYYKMYNISYYTQHAVKIVYIHMTDFATLTARSNLPKGGII
jgi:hypothetical protein